MNNRADGEEFDTDYEEDIVCPYCGYRHCEPEWSGGDGEFDCDNCDREFRVEEYVEITYSTRKIEENEE